jgi:hypothetical protein
MPEMSTDFSPAPAASNSLEKLQPIGWWVRGELLRILKPRTANTTPKENSPVVNWSERNEWVTLCVKFGLNAREIVDLSYSWPQPITTVQQVYDKISQLHLERLYKRKDRKRAGDHNRNIIYAFSKLTGQALEYGLGVWNVMRDSCPDGMRFRPDLSLVIDHRTFHVEVQLSKIEGTRWGEKFRNYVRLYKSIKKPFRVLILVDKREDVSKLCRNARKTLKDHPDLNLFLFMTLEQFRFAPDVIKAPVWRGVWSDKPQGLH